MLKVGIAIDAWKLPIFKRHLKSAGYSFKKHPGLTEDTLTLTVMTNSVEDLKPVVEAANTEARKTR